MATLILTIGEGKGSFANGQAIAQATKWEKIIVITTPFFLDKFQIQGSQIIVLDEQKPINEIVKNVKEELKNLEGEVGVNITSGSGKIHMATIAALIKLPIGIRFVTTGPKGIEEI